MKTPSRVTDNMAEVMYLLYRGNCIVDVAVKPTAAAHVEAAAHVVAGAPSGFVFVVRLEGPRLEEDLAAWARERIWPFVRNRFFFDKIAQAVRSSDYALDEAGRALLGMW